MGPGPGPHTPHAPDPVDLEEPAPCPVALTFRPALPAFLGNVFPFASLRFVMTQTGVPSSVCLQDDGSSSISA